MLGAHWLTWFHYMPKMWKPIEEEPVCVLGNRVHRQQADPELSDYSSPRKRAYRASF